MLVWLCLRSPSATASMLDTCDSMPIFTALGAVPENTDATAMSENTASICAVMNSGGMSRMALTPSVFCAVSAVMTAMP